MPQSQQPKDAPVARQKQDQVAEPSPVAAAEGSGHFADGYVGRSAPRKKDWCREAAVGAILGSYSLLFLGALLASWQGWLLRQILGDGSRLPLLQSAAYVICAGGLGSTTYCIRAFYYYTIKHDFLFDTYFWWYLFRPIFGAILAVAAFCLTKGGIAAFGGGTASSGGTNFALFGMGYLAGFGSEQVVERLRLASKAAFGIEKSLGNEKQRADGDRHNETGQEQERL